MIQFILARQPHPIFIAGTSKLLRSALRGYSQRCVVSLVDDYAKTRNRLSKIPAFVPLSQASSEFRIVLEALIPDLVEIAEHNQFEMVSCAEVVDLQQFGINPGKCVDDDLIRRVFDLDLEYKKDPGQRSACRCLPSQDIGRYDTCPFGCQYCYANRSFEQAVQYYKSHNSDQMNL